MGNSLLMTPMLSDAATLSTTAPVAASMPLNYLQKTQPTDTCRWTDTTQVTFDVDLTAAYASAGVSSWNFLALLFTNFAAGDQVTIKTASSQANLTSSPAFTSTTDAWPDPGLTTWDRPPFVLWLGSSGRSENWLRVSVTASGGSSYREAGRLYIADAYQVSGLRYGTSTGFGEEEIIQEAEGGPEYAYERPRARSREFTLEAHGPSAQAEIHTHWLEIQRLRGVSKDVLFVLDPEDTTYLAQNTIYGRLRPASEQNNPAFRLYTLTLRIKEML